jgi:hypothetical protein
VTGRGAASAEVTRASTRPEAASISLDMRILRATPMPLQLLDRTTKPGRSPAGVAAHLRHLQPCE